MSRGQWIVLAIVVVASLLTGWVVNRAAADDSVHPQCRDVGMLVSLACTNCTFRRKCAIWQVKVALMRPDGYSKPRR